MGAVTVTARAEDVVREAMPADPSAEVRDAWIKDAVACVRRHGAIIIRNAVPTDVIATVLEDFKVRHDVHMTPGQKRLPRRFQPDPLRAQAPVAIDGPAANPALFAPPSVTALVTALMGEDLIIGETGVVISHAGAGPQDAHRDSSFLFGGLDLDVALPPFAMTLLIPLLDVTLGMGPTEFWPGSHLICDQMAVLEDPPVRMAMEAGSVLLLDARIVHRGGANVSGPVRPTIYFSYHRRWYAENPGYEEKPQVRVTPKMLSRLPETHRPLFAWALHLNRTDNVSEFVYRWAARLTIQLRRLKRA